MTFKIDYGYADGYFIENKWNPGLVEIFGRVSHLNPPISPRWILRLNTLGSVKMKGLFLQKRVIIFS